MSVWYMRGVTVYSGTNGWLSVYIQQGGFTLH